jgi:hypothetical protein
MELVYNRIGQLVFGSDDHDVPLGINLFKAECDYRCLPDDVLLNTSGRSSLP